MDRKINVDASLDHDLLRGTTDAILRDDEGRFIAGENWRIDWCTYVLPAKALTLRYGLSIAQKAGCNRLVISFNNIKVIETMINGEWSASTAVAVFDDCYFLTCDFFITSFEHCNREAN
jgi:hypothetical protein